MIHHQNPLFGSCIRFLSGSHIDRKCRCRAEKSSYPRCRAKERTNLRITLSQTGAKVSLQSIPGFCKCPFATKRLLRCYTTLCSSFSALYIQRQRIAFLPRGKSTRVQVWLEIKLQISNSIDFRKYESRKHHSLPDCLRPYMHFLSKHTRPDPSS